MKKKSNLAPAHQIIVNICLMLPIIFNETSTRSHASNPRPKAQGVTSLQRLIEEHSSSTVLLDGRYGNIIQETSFGVCHPHVYTRLSGRWNQDGIVISMPRSEKSTYLPFTTRSRSIFGNRSWILRGVRGHWDRFLDNFCQRDRSRSVDR
jgi:hypothetical protein